MSGIARRLMMAGARPIELVGFVSATSGNALSLSGLGLQPNDLVIAWSSNAESSSLPSISSSGWTTDYRDYEQFQAVIIAHKTMGPTPDATVNGLKVSSSSGAMAAAAFRNMGPSATRETISTAEGTVNPPSATTSQEKALSLVFTMLGGTQVTPSAAPTGWTFIGNVKNTTETDSGSASAYRVLGGAGSYDPPAFTGSAEVMLSFHLIITP